MSEHKQIEGAAETIIEVADLDLGKLLGFRDLCEDVKSTGDLIEALGALHNKIGDGGETPIPVSDRRLKSDVSFRRTTESGLRLYDFRYVGDEQVFFGVMAQDLLQDDRHAHAVSVSADGYFRVDYAALGLSHLVTGAMCEAGGRALSAASQRPSA